jgi:hypothetical protein
MQIDSLYVFNVGWSTSVKMASATDQNGYIVSLPYFLVVLKLTGDLCASLVRHRFLPGGRLPHSLVQVSRALADVAVKQGRNRTRLPFHEGRIVLPRPEEGLLVGLIERKDVHEHNRRVYRTLRSPRDH